MMEIGSKKDGRRRKEMRRRRKGEGKYKKLLEYKVKSIET